MVLFQAVCEDGIMVNNLLIVALIQPANVALYVGLIIFAQE